MTAAAAAWAPTTAMAWECASIGAQPQCGCIHPGGAVSTLRPRIGSFTAQESDILEDVADMWSDPFTGGANPGVDFTFVIGTTIPVWNMFDGRNGTAMLAPAAMPAGVPNDEFAVTVIRNFDSPICARQEADIAFRTDPVWDPVSQTFTGTWSTSPFVEGTLGPNEISFSNVATHQFGHWLGLGNDDSDANIMLSEYPAVEQGNATTIAEDEYVGLRAAKGIGGAVQLNFTLSRMEWSSSTSTVSETWSDDNTTETGPWEGCPGDILTGPDRPRGVISHVLENGTSYTVRTRWTLSSDDICFDADDRTVGTRTATIGSNSPNTGQRPVTWRVPQGMFGIPDPAPGLYYLCAKIDDLNQHAELDETDNFVRSEKMFEILGGSKCK
jgi:hypothetical protein